MKEPPLLTVTAIHAALAAGDLLRKGFGTICEIESKPGKQNLVTQFDKAAEKCIIGQISKEFPAHSFLAEESGASLHDTGPVLWVIDPLDGTVNFAHQLPLFSVSIAATIAGKTVCGVVYQPMTNELFVAEKGRGAYLNGKRIHVTETGSFGNAFVATGFPYDIDHNPLHCIDRFTEMLQQGVPIRRLGSAALDLSYVAAGRFDAYWEVSLCPWDIAAGKLLVEEAGGTVTHWDGKNHPTFSHETVLATNGLLHETMITHLNRKTP